MTDKQKDHLKPICPSCGQPFTFSLVDKVGFIVFTLLLGYVLLSMILFMMSLPVGLRRHQTNPAPWDLWMQPLSNEPIFQIFVGGGLVIGVLMIYWNWLQNIYKKLEKKTRNPD